jgi:glycosyltransferase involved in cell wall biosynthesis
MKLLYLLPEYVTNAGGGIITFYRNFLPQLAAQGHEVRVIVGSGVTAVHAPAQVVIDGVSVEMLDHAMLDQYHARFARYAALPGLRRFLAGAWAMWEQAKRGEGYDLVEAADWGLLFLPWVVEQGPPAVVQLHGSMGQIDLHDPVRGEEVHGNLIRMIERTGISKAACAQTLSQANADFWQRQTGRAVDRILPAWQPLLAPDFSSPLRQARGLVVGRVQRWKGPEVLCQALRLLGAKAPLIDWMGRDTSYESRNIKTSDHLRQNWPDIWGKIVTHQPQQPFEQTAHLQAAAAFMVVPSLWDIFNFTCVEAMGTGTPVICSTGAGASELIEDGVNGFVFENGSAESLAAAIERLLSLSETERSELAEAGRQTALRELDPVEVCRQRLAAYENIVRTGAGRALPSDDWLRLACEPGKAVGHESLDFLDHLPLKSLVDYSTRRAIQKLRN